MTNNTYTRIYTLDRFLFFLFFYNNFRSQKFFSIKLLYNILYISLCVSRSLEHFMLFCFDFPTAFRSVVVDVRAIRSALRRRKCNSVARATQSRDTAERVACSNGISTRERVRGHAHERTGALACTSEL